MKAIKEQDKYYTIKTIDNDKEVYLCKNWISQDNIWITKEELTQQNVFTSSRGAKHSISSLLKKYSEYEIVKFSIIELDNSLNEIKQK